MSTFIFSAIISAFLMGIFYLFDAYFSRKRVYRRPSQAMIISSFVPLILTPITMLLPWWKNPSLLVWVVGISAGAILIWANWFYFLVMFPKKKSDIDSLKGSTELSLYESATPVIALLIAFIAGHFFTYVSDISYLQSFFVVMTVVGMMLFALVDGTVVLKNWNYRLKLISFALLAATSQTIQDIALDQLQLRSGMNVIEASFSLAPALWLGMSTGLLILFFRKERQSFKVQWTVIKQYFFLICLAEIIALLSYAALIYAYAGEHVATAQAIGSSFPIVVFVGGLLLQKYDYKDGEHIASKKNIVSKLLLIILILLSVTGVILF